MDCHCYRLEDQEVGVPEIVQGQVREVRDNDAFLIGLEIERNMGGCVRVTADFLWKGDKGAKTHGEMYEADQQSYANPRVCCSWIERRNFEICRQPIMYSFIDHVSNSLGNDIRTVLFPI